MATKRIKTDYPGVFFRETKRVSVKGTEKVYYVVFKKDGKLFEEKVGRQYVDAMTPAKAARIRSDRIEGKRLSRKEVRQKEREKKTAWTINRLWEEYKSQKNLKGLAQDQSRFSKYISPYLGHKEPHTILPLDVDRLRINKLSGKSQQTIKLTLSLLRRIVFFGHDHDLCAPLPFKIKLPSVNNLVTEDLSMEQLGNLIDTLNSTHETHAANLMKMALFTGMRRGEMFKLKWEDVDFDRRFISIIDPKGGQNQKIPLNDAARDLLQSIIRTETPFVFPGRGGRQRTDINKHVNRIKQKAGLPKDFRPLHGLRHVYASMLASSGQVDMYTLQKLLTHKSPMMTQRYAHLRDETLRRASDLAGELIGEIVSGKKGKESRAKRD
jgi:integrase